MSIRTTPVRLQDVDKPVEVAKVFNEVFDALRELEVKLNAKAKPVEAKPDPPKAKKGKNYA